MVANERLMLFQADILAVPVIRLRITEETMSPTIRWSPDDDEVESSQEWIVYEWI